MCNEVENKKDIYLDLSRFSEMETEEIITYLKDNPDKKISPEYAEASGFFEISEDIKASGEEELAIKFLELYYNAIKPSTHYTEVDWDCYQEDYDEEKKWKKHNLIINLIDDYAHSGSVKSAKALAFAYEEGILVEESKMQTDYYLDLAHSNAEEE